MNTFILWLVPPLVGAGIGYLTNAVAIKMLFRPLKKLYLLGIPLPFTPGILPRERHKLAENIGAMVERELLTVEVLSDRLHRPDVQDGVKASVGAYTEKILAASPLTLFRALGPVVGLAIDSVVGPALEGGLLSALLRDLVQSPGGKILLETLGEAAAEKGRGILGKSLRDLAGEAGRGNLEAVLGEKLDAFLEKTQAESGFWEDMLLTVRGFYPQAATAFIGFLNRDYIHRELEVQGQVFLSRVFLKMNVFQRFFISAGQYDKTLQERMPEIIDDLIDQAGALLSETAVRDRILLLIPGALKSALAEGENRRRLARFCMDRLKVLASRPLGDFISPEELDRLGAFLQKLPSLLLPEKTGSLPLSRLFLEKLVKKLEDAQKAGNGGTIGAFLALGRERKAALDDLIAGKICSLTDDQIGAALGSINVKALVADRIDSLDMIRVEKIVLDVMANQLKWINVFGAILGALIGACQSALSLLIR